MRKLWILGLLLTAAWAAPPLPRGPLCRVQATSEPVTVGRRVTVTLRPGCPAGGQAQLRLASRWGGSLPDDPPGVFTLRPGETLERISFPWWWLEWRDASGRWWRVRETDQS